MVMTIDLDRLPRIVEHRAGKNLNEVGITDCDRERGVLGQIEVLIGERRNDDAHRLRNDDQPQRRAAPQPKRIGGLSLPLRDGGKARTHRFGDERGGIGHEPGEQRDEFRQDLDAAANVETPDLRIIECNARAAGDEGHGRRTKHEQSRHGKARSRRRRAISAAPAAARNTSAAATPARNATAIASAPAESRAAAGTGRDY